jgi:chromatin remodeling complex protein RSC6
MSSSSEVKNIPSDDDIKNAVTFVLGCNVANLDVVTTGSIIKQIQEEKGWSLIELGKKPLVKEAIATFLETETGGTDVAVIEKEEGSEEATKSKKKGGYGNVQLSTELSNFMMGVVSMPRTDVSKEIWKYIKAEGFQDPKDGRKILCKGKLEALFPNRKTVNMFKMTALLNKHMKSIEDLQSGAIKKEKHSTKKKGPVNSKSQAKKVSKAVASKAKR